jgi:fimbrial isopeptide formation D2 family protein/uncharacterized repeat protein (TIGR01451 family)
MKIKAMISIIMALLITVSTSVVVANDGDECGSGLVYATGVTYPFGEVIKEVYDGEGWVDHIEAEVDDVLMFRITLIFHCSDHPNAFSCREINVTDILPNCLSFKDAQPSPTSVSGKEVFWDSPVAEPIYEGDSVVLYLNATVEQCTEPNGEKNFVEVEALEKCSSYPLYQNDTVTVVVPCEPECGYIEVTKKIFDGCQWVDHYDAEIGEEVLFNITITYHAGTDNCFKATDIVVTDTISPGGLSYTVHDFTYTPSEMGPPIVWNLTEDYGVELLDGESVSIEFEVTPTSGSGTFENCANVTAIEHCCECPLYGEDCADFTVEEECGDIEVIKKVWDGCKWVDSAEAEVGEVVSFKIEITYNAGCGFEATDIVVVDTINPNGLTYTYHSSNYAPSISGNPIQWNLTEDHGVELADGESVSIFLNLTIVSGSGTLENCVEVNALEHCCECPLYGEDCAEVTVECEPEIEVIKKVWNGTAWSEYLDQVHLGKIVKFRIEVIYHACDNYKILNMVVRDELPCCLEYLETTLIDSTGTIHDDPTIEVVNGKTVYWNWTYGELLELVDGDNLVIEFNSNVTQYCRGIDDNWVYVEAWGCSGPHFFGEDNATVDCTPPEPLFYKGGTKEGIGWELEEIKVNKSDIATFQLVLYYYGGEPLEDVQFVDVMPCVLEYANNAHIYLDYDTPESEITDNFTIELSADGKTIWFNSTGGFIVEDGDSIAVRFDAEVVGVTGTCPDCECDAKNYGYVTGKVGCVQEPNFFMEDDIKIISGCPSGNCPPTIPAIRGPTNGLVDDELTFYFLSSDPDDDQIYYKIDFAGDVTGWIGPSGSGVEISRTYTFDEPGTYKIKAKAKDDQDLESGWTPVGYEFEVTITEEPVQDVNLSVTVRMFGFGKVVADVENIGENDLTDINYEFDGTGGILGKAVVNDTGEIDSLDVDEVKSIESAVNMTGLLKFGFGPISGKITLSVDGEEVEEEFSGWLLGKLILII